MARRSPKGLRARLVVLLCVLSSAATLGAVVGGYEAQSTYAIVKIDGLVELINAYNTLRWECFERNSYRS